MSAVSRPMPSPAWEVAAGGTAVPITRSAMAAGSSSRLTARYGARGVASITWPVTGRSADRSM